MGEGEQIARFHEQNKFEDYRKLNARNVLEQRWTTGRELFFLLQTLPLLQTIGFRNLGKTSVLSYKLFTSCFCPWLKNVVCMKIAIVSHLICRASN